jgi:hypothetical protein
MGTVTELHNGPAAEVGFNCRFQNVVGAGTFGDSDELSVRGQNPGNGGNNRSRGQEDG